MKHRVILDSKSFELTLNRICFQLIENHTNFENTVLIGMQPRGIYLAKRLQAKLIETTKNTAIKCGELDVTFYRDDFRRRDLPLTAQSTAIDFLIENKNVILIDDVLYTGRTIRAGLDALMDFGRPDKVELLVLIDRRFSRHLPIQPDFIGTTVDSVTSEKVEVQWKDTDGEDKVILYTENQNGTT